MKKKVKYPLGSPTTCMACNMELLPFLVEDGTGSLIFIPEMYCDGTCKQLFRKYPSIFGKGFKERRLEELGYCYAKSPD